MPTYTVQLDGLLTTANTTEGPLCAAMFTQLKNFLLNNSASLGTQLIAEGSGFAYTNQRITGEAGSSTSIQTMWFNPADLGCGGANSGRKGKAVYVWDIVHGTTSGQWCCIRFASASIPFDVLIHNFSGSRTREGRPQATWQGDSTDSVPTQNGYRTNVNQISSVFNTSVDCAPVGAGGNDYSLFTRTEEGVPSAFTEGDNTIFTRTGFFYLGTRTQTDQRMRGGGLGIQIAQRADGGEPWVLGTGSQTGLFIPATATAMASASQAVPNSPYQWTSGSSTLGIFPISNSRLSNFFVTTSNGHHVTSSKNMFPIMIDRGTAQASWATRYHLLADPDNLLIVTSDAQATGFTSQYKFCYFGKYTPHKDVHPNYPWTMQVPYVFLGTMLGTTEPTIPASKALIDGVIREPTIWGSWQGFETHEGGSWYPSSSLGVSSVMLDLPNRSRDPDLNPNRMIGNGAPQYDRYCFGLWLTGSAGRSHPGISYLGRVGELVRAISGLASHDQTSDLKYAVVGNAGTTQMETNFAVGTGDPHPMLRQKMVIPWNGTTLIGANSSSSGLTGSITTVFT